MPCSIHKVTHSPFYIYVFFVHNNIKFASVLVRLKFKPNCCESSMDRYMKLWRQSLKGILFFEENEKTKLSFRTESYQLSLSRRCWLQIQAWRYWQHAQGGNSILRTSWIHEHSFLSIYHLLLSRHIHRFHLSFMFLRFYVNFWLWRGER